jgi:alpha-D-ribose 1-methylphosphonate 5-triphosphate diphosphatase PhnM
VPAAALGRADLGRIARGSRADLAWLAPDGDLPLRARATWVGGLLRRRPGAPSRGPAGRVGP